MIYSGIGSRNTPVKVLHLMTDIAMHMSEHNWILRSGGANGADSAFEMGAGTNKEIYLPWQDFNGNTSRLYLGNGIDPRAEDIAEKVWKDRSITGQILIEVNTQQDNDHICKLFSIDNDILSRKLKYVNTVCPKALPLWSSLRSSTKKFMTRNIHQVLGSDLETNTKIVICWTADGKSSGGTGQATHLANMLDIPTCNLQKEENRAVMYEMIRSNIDPATVVEDNKW